MKLSEWNQQKLIKKKEEEYLLTPFSIRSS